ncbi:hypothetical protein DFJ73DRAFT_238332 [Zopfochytrium polystomum]|nr:hypothetical protein DFJ73DRAFT_238332 [Zopfochytrium polystomum]
MEKLTRSLTVGGSAFLSEVDVEVVVAVLFFATDPPNRAILAASTSGVGLEVALCADLGPPKTPAAPGPTARGVVIPKRSIRRRRFSPSDSSAAVDGTIVLAAPVFVAATVGSSSLTSSSFFAVSLKGMPRFCSSSVEEGRSRECSERDTVYSWSKSHDHQVFGATRRAGSIRFSVTGANDRWTLIVHSCLPCLCAQKAGREEQA